MLYHVYFHVGILLIKPPQPQTHLSVAAGHYALCLSLQLCVSVHTHSRVSATGMLKAPIISMENAWLLTSRADMSVLLGATRMPHRSGSVWEIKIRLWAAGKQVWRRERWAREYVWDSNKREMKIPSMLLFAAS